MPQKAPDAVDVEEKLTLGACSIKIRKTFKNARSVLDQLQARFPCIDRGYILYLLREQTRFAEIFTPAYREQGEAWADLCKALDKFLVTVFDRTEGVCRAFRVHELDD